MTGARGTAIVLSVFGLAAGTASGCANDESTAGSSPAQATPSVRVVVTRDNRSLGRRCGPGPVARALVGFFDAVNSGDRDRLEAVVADAGRFQGYAVSETGHRLNRRFALEGPASDVAGASAHDVRPRLFSYLATRHRHGERIRLLTVGVTGAPPRRWFSKVREWAAGFEYTAHRTADDLSALGGANSVVSGKGAVTCRDRRLLLLTMGLDRRRPPQGAPLCPRPRSRAKEPARPSALACTRR